MSANLGQILDPRNSAVVTSCAGSGKTWMLIARIMRALLAGARPEEVLAITFTRKATGEIRERVHEKLKEFETADDAELARLLEEIRAGTDTATLRRARALRRECLLSERDMSIHTFHGWFHMLLRSQPWLPVARPYNDIIENDRLVIEDAWGLLMGKTDREKPTGKALLELLGDHDYQLESIKEVLLRLIESRALWMLHTQGVGDPVGQAAAAFEEANGVDLDADPVGELRRDRPFLDGVALVCEEVARSGTPGQQATYSAKELLPAEGEDEEAHFGRLRKAFLTYEGNPRRLDRFNAFKPLYADGTLDDVFGRILEAKEVFDGIKAARFNRRALAVAVAWLDEYARLKGDNRQCDNNDLEVDAWKLLTSGDVNAITLQYKMDRAYRHILVDEFQDTSPLQWEALRTWLEASKDAGPDHKPPKVFIIGDPKQSIYRFRGGNPLLLDRARAYLEERYGGRFSSEDDTRRCSPVIVALANRMFEEGGRAGTVMEGYRPHTALFGDRPGRVEVLPLAVRPKKEKKAETNEPIPLRDPLTQKPDDRTESDDEAQLVARRILQAKESWLVEDGEGRRPCEWGDFMVLYAQSTKLHAFERALRANGVPCAAARRGSALQSLECGDVLALLTFVVNPGNNLALAQALRSPIFGVSEEELVKVAARRAAGWLWHGFAAAKEGELSERLRFVRKRLKDWRELYLTRPLPAHDFISHVYQRGEILERYARAVPGDLRKRVQDNLLSLLHLSLSLGGGRHPQLPMFLREVRRHSRHAGSELNDAPMKDQVALLSIHSAKGLEKPFVFIVDAMRTAWQFGSSARAGDLLHEWPEDSDRPTLVALAPTKHKTAKTRELLDRAKGEEEREWFNMLYVAVTRARQGVVISGSVPEERMPDPDASPGDDETRWYVFANHAARELGAAEGEDGRRELGDDLARGEPAAPAPAAEERKGAARDAGRRRPRKTVGKPHKGTTEELLRGKLFHSLMTLRILGVDDPKVAADAVAVRQDAFDGMWEKTGKVFGAKDLRRFFDPEESVNRTCETSLIGADKEIHRPDYLVEFEDEIWILDFKTGEIGPRMEKYREQLGTYRDCVAELRQDKPVRCAIVSEHAELIRV